jgi:CheY-like chemotaxis protein
VCLSSRSMAVRTHPPRCLAEFLATSAGAGGNPEGVSLVGLLITDGSRSAAMAVPQSSHARPGRDVSFCSEGGDAINEAVLPIEADPKDESLALHAVKDGNLGDEVAIARNGTEALGYPLGAGSERHVLPRLGLPKVELPKMNGLAWLQHLREDERTKALLVVTSPGQDPPPPLNERGLGGTTRRPVTAEEFEEPAPRPGLRWPMRDKASPEGRGPES